MASKLIEQVLNAHNYVDDFEVDIDDNNSKYIVDVDFIAPRDNEDMSQLLKLKNKIRSKVNKPYKVDFIIRFTT